MSIFTRLSEHNDLMFRFYNLFSLIHVGNWSKQLMQVISKSRAEPAPGAKMAWSKEPSWPQEPCRASLEALSTTPKKPSPP